MAAAAIACSTSGPPSAAPSPRATPTAQPTVAAPPTPAASPTPVAEAQRVEAPLPEPREEGGAAFAQGRLYVIGGFDPAGASSPSVFYFDGSWHPGPRLPLGLDHPGVTSLGDRVYVAGGYSAGRASARLFRLDGEAWSELASMKRARGGLALVGQEGVLYALAGLSGGAVDVAEAFEVAGGAWHDLPRIPRPRDHVSGFAWLGLACAAGGRSPNTSLVNCFDPGALAWKDFAPLPFATSGAGAGVLGDEIIVAGGEDAQESQMVDEVATYRSGAWSVSKMLVPRHGFSLAPYQGRLWACGGGTQPGLHAVSTCTSFR